MNIVTLILIATGFGLVFGGPSVFLRRATVTFYRIYSGLCLSLVGLLLAFRYTLRVVSLDLHGPIDEQLFTFLGIALGLFYIPYVAAFGVSTWVVSRLMRP